MYRKFILSYKTQTNGYPNSITVCFEWNEQEINTKKKEFLKDFLSNPIFALDFNWNPLYGHWQIPFSAKLV